MFYLVRHALTAHTGNRLSGRASGIDLTDEGHTQAEALADQLADVRLKAVYSSPLERTMQTAESIAARHGLEVRARQDIGEVEYGSWTNRTFGTLQRTKLWDAVAKWPSGVRFPKGEMLTEVQARAVAEVEKLRTQHPRAAVCLVSHADVIRLIAAHYLGAHIDLYQRLVIWPASISVIAIGEDGPRVLALNTLPAGLQARG